MGLKFRRQHPIDRFIVDFYCHKYKLVIELDGSIHNLPEVAEKDKNREEELREFVLRILRYSNEKILHNRNEVLKRMQQEIELMQENTDPLFRP